MEIRNIDRKNYRACLELRLRPGQEHFVADNAHSLAEAAYEEGLFPRAVYEGETMVGFVLYDYDPEIPGWSMSRFMLGAQFQGRGLGRRAAEAFLSYFQKTVGAGAIHISVSLDNAVARALYRSLGFVERGPVSYVYGGRRYHEMRMVKTF